MKTRLIQNESSHARGLHRSAFSFCVATKRRRGAEVKLGRGSLRKGSQQRITANHEQRAAACGLLAQLSVLMLPQSAT